MDEKKKKKKKKKGDRCIRIAKRKYDVWPSAYASGAVVKCRKGKIWKGLSEEELNEMISQELEESLGKGVLDKLRAGVIGATIAAAGAPPAQAAPEKPAVVQQDKQEANVVKKNGVSYIGSQGYSNRILAVSERYIGKNEQLSQSEYVKEQLEILNNKNSKKLFSAKDKSNGPYRMVELVVREIQPGEKIVDININDNMRDQFQQVEDALGKDWEKRFSGEFWGAQGKNNPTHYIYKTKAELEEEKKPDFKKEKESGLHGWFSRQGGKGKSKGWVDCNTCRKDKKTGKKTCKTCGRKEGEKRSKYPACRPKPSDCGSSGKGDEWGKKSKKEALQIDQDLIESILSEVLKYLD